MHINVSGAQAATPSRIVKRGKNSQLYSLGHSSVRVHEVEKSLVLYPLKNTADYLIQGLKFGFKLQYSGPRIPVKSNNSKSVAEYADVVR